MSSHLIKFDGNDADLQVGQPTYVCSVHAAYPAPYLHKEVHRSGNGRTDVFVGVRSRTVDCFGSLPWIGTDLFWFAVPS